MSLIMLLGGSGFIGQALAPKLVAAGHDVISVARTPPVTRLAGIQYVDCSYDNLGLLDTHYRRANLVFHLASDTTPATSKGQAALEISSNLLPTARLLEFLESCSDTSLVFVSSGGTVYGNTEGKRAETTAFAPIAYHGAGKASIEMFLNAYAQQSGNPVIALRPANLYGPGQVTRQQFGVIPALFDCLARGNTFRLMGDGSIKRDFIYIDDFCTLCLGIAEDLPLAHGKMQSFNVGSGSGVSLSQLVELVQRASGRKLTIEQVPARSVDVREIVLDSSKVAERFGWSPQTNLQAGLEATWAWFLENGC